MLISRNLDFQVLDTFTDVAENILGLHITIHNHPFILTSVYGPNTVDLNFFADIRRCFQLNPDAILMCGGDWNLTYSTADTDNNIDIFRMASPPSLIRSRNLAEISDFYNLSDPFRALHPDRLDFSYRPRNGLPNRSRIDFFLISDSLLEYVSNCDISAEIPTELFDHHRITLNFNTKNFKPKQNINNTILSHPRFLDVLHAAAADTYLSHASALNPGIDLDTGKREVGSFLLLLREINDLEYDIILNGETDAKTISKENKVTELAIKKNSLPSPEQLNIISLDCPDDTFLEVLMGNIRNSLISFQSWVKKT